MGKHRREEESRSSKESGTKKKKKKHSLRKYDDNYNKSKSSSVIRSGNTNTNTTAVLLLAATATATLSQTNNNKHDYCCSSSSSSSCYLIKLCLKRLGILLFSSNSNSNSNSNSSSPQQQQQTLPVLVLSLIPSILSSKCAEVVRCGAEFVGMASLFSYQTNQLIASDSHSLLSLLSALRITTTRPSSSDSSSLLLLALSNALLDLSATHFGRRQLIHFSALETLMLKFLQVPKAPDFSVSLCATDDHDGDVMDITSVRIALKENELPVLLLNAALLLIQSCDIHRLEMIPLKLSKAFFSYLQDIWGKVIRTRSSSNSTTQRGLKFYSTNIRISDLAQNIFRLSTVRSSFPKPLPFEMVKDGIFGHGDSSFKDFMLNYWETSPFIVDRVSRISTLEDYIFGPFLHSLKSKPSDPSFISTMLQGMVSCLPISSDELDIVSFLKEFEGRLGAPLIYKQDIRVLKTDTKLHSELHYFQDSSTACPVKNPLYLGADNIMKCEEAFREGYTIALRGMEFRFKSVAAIADALAAVFGQPSAGANLYLTPPSAQGLTRHYDDHCVFVCQLFGTKSWKLFPNPVMRLPRLYEPLDNSYSLGHETSMSESKQVLLREGDILYIPRGVPHEACTHTAEVEESSGYSLHLTLGIEVEPPFEWEGFAHVALHCWIVNQKRSDYDGTDSISVNLGIIAVNLLHVVISFIGESDPMFRKACLVAATLPSDANDWLRASQKIIFSHMMEKINSILRFTDVVTAVELSSQKKENLLYQLRWLQHLHFEGENSMRCYCTTLMSTDKLLDICSQHRYKAETTFLQTKYNFCNVALSDHVFDKYKSLLESYQKVRKQYRNGMLSLHRN